MAKFEQLTGQQRINCFTIDKELVNIGLTNKYLRAGILAVCSKESGFKPIIEGGYSRTPAARIAQIFSGKFQGWSELQINSLKADEKAFFNHVYNRKDLGNLNHGDGYKYRGRGFNQLTGRANYANVGKAIGVDLVNNPELLETPEVAAKALAYFFRSSIVGGQTSGKFLLRYGIVTTSQISTIEKGATIAHQANMGWGMTPSQDPTGGFQITMADAPSYLALTGL